MAFSIKVPFMVASHAVKRAGTAWALTKAKAGVIAFNTSDSNKFWWLEGSTVRKGVSEDGTQTLTNKTFTSPVITGALQNVAVRTTTPIALLSTNSGQHNVLDLGTPITVTLPAPVVGTVFRFSTKQNAAHVIVTDAGTTFLRGTVIAALEATTPSANDGPKMFTANGTSHTTMTLGTTKGGHIGSQFEFVCVSATVWQLTGVSLCTGIIVTPFS